MSARVVVTGNAVTAPDHKITTTGRSRTAFRIGSTERRLDRESGQWSDGDKFFIGVTCWGALADNVLTSVKLGCPLIVTGRIAQRTYLDKDDRTQFTFEVTADTVAPDLNRGSADFTRISRVNGPNLGVDESGNAAMVTTDHPDDRPASTTASATGSDTLAVLAGGGFRTATGEVFGAPSVDDDAAEPEDAELVGAHG